MLQVARLSPKLLGDSTDLILGFLKREQRDGAFLDRSGQPDLYYTVFGLECLRALSAPIDPSVTGYLETFGAGDGLDLVHLSSLIRCWANVVRGNIPNSTGLAQNLEKFEPATVYNYFLTMGACQDLGLPIKHNAILQSLQAADGAYANQPGAPTGLTSATAAAIGIFRQLQQPIPTNLRQWLLERHHPTGGFLAAPMAPIPDLLSTATALHALVSIGASIEPIRETTLDYIDTLWTTRGGFLGSWADETLDPEYTFYGLLSLGYLSL